MAAAPALAGISHGTSSAEGQAAVASLMTAVAEALPGVAVAAGFVDVQHPDTEETLEGLADSADATIVPLLLSAGYHVHVDLTDAVRDHRGREVTLGGALGPDDRIVALLIERLEAAGLTKSDALVLAVAGSSDARAVRDCREVGQRLAEASGHRVSVGFLSAASPRLEDVIAAVRVDRPDARIVVSSYLLAPGYFQNLASRAGGDVITDPLLTAGGPAPTQLVDVVVDRYRTCSACTACAGFCRRQF